MSQEHEGIVGIRTLINRFRIFNVFNDIVRENQLVKCG